MDEINLNVATLSMHNIVVIKVEDGTEIGTATAGAILQLKELRNRVEDFMDSDDDWEVYKFTSFISTIIHPLSFITNLFIRE